MTFILTIFTFINSIAANSQYWYVISWLGCGKKDKYSSDNLCYLQDFDKLYDRLIAYLIFEIGFDTKFYYSKIDLEDFNQTVAILKKSHWLLHTMLSFFLNSFQ